MLFMSEFLVGAVAFAFRNALTRTLSNEMRFAIENHYNASDRGSLASPSVASIWDNIQTNVSKIFEILLKIIRNNLFHSLNAVE